VLFPKLYDWAVSLHEPNATLEDIFRWHRLYSLYIKALPKLDDQRSCSRDLLIECHLRNVPKTAGKIAREFGFMPWPGQGFDAWDGYEDLIHELTAAGNEGLIIAADRFDSRVGKFSTYASYWIEKFVRLDASFLVSVVKRGGDELPRFDLSLSADRGQVEIGSVEGSRLVRYHPHQNSFGVAGVTEAATASTPLATQLAEGLSLISHGLEGDTAEVAAADYRQYREAWEIEDVLDTAEQTAKRVLTQREYRIFTARYLTTKAVKLKWLVDEFEITEGRVRAIGKRAREKVQAAMSTPLKPQRTHKQLIAQMARFYIECAPLRTSKIDDWLDLAKRKFPEATWKDRRDAWLRTGQVCKPRVSFARWKMPWRKPSYIEDRKDHETDRTPEIISEPLRRKAA
jgi:RNA polymerase sigma-32 factor